MPKLTLAQAEALGVVFTVSVVIQRTPRSGDYNRLTVEEYRANAPLFTQHVSVCAEFSGSEWYTASDNLAVLEADADPADLDALKLRALHLLEEGAERMMEELGWALEDAKREITRAEAYLTDTEHSVAQWSALIAAKEAPDAQS